MCVKVLSCIPELSSPRRLDESYEPFSVFMLIFYLVRHLRSCMSSRLNLSKNWKGEFTLPPPPTHSPLDIVASYYTFCSSYCCVLTFWSARLNYCLQFYYLVLSVLKHEINQNIRVVGE